MNKMLIAALMLFTVNAAASIKDDALLILERAGLGLSIDKPNGCAVAEIGEPTRITKVSCMGPEFERYTLRAWNAFEKAGYIVEEVGLGFSIRLEERI